MRRAIGLQDDLVIWEPTMDHAGNAVVLDILCRNNILAMATIREDGWPQAATLGYVNDGATLYAACRADSQIVADIEQRRVVSVTVGSLADPTAGNRELLIGASAEIMTEPVEMISIAARLLHRFPQLAAGNDGDSDQLAILRISPKQISICASAIGQGNAVTISTEATLANGSPFGHHRSAAPASI